MKERSLPNKGLFTAAVRANRQIGPRFYRITLEFSADGAKAMADCQPGQFVQVDLSAAAVPTAKAIPRDLIDKAQRRILLRRPFSFADVTVKGSKTLADILYCVVGPGSLRMTTLSAGDSVSVIGPLGNGFSVPQGKKTALLVAGGMGAGPLQHLGKVLAAEHSDINVIAFAGAKAAQALPFEKRLDQISQELGFSLAEYAEHGIESLVATDDGSAGYKGPVTECVADWLDRANLSGAETVIYGCGPEAMLAHLAKIAAERKIDCQVSMERLMACGIGLCQSCAVECKTDRNQETVYKLCCQDGPVFGTREVVFGK
jgi:dihydroorotate dehydrogenase electron transfer subunit